MASFKIIHYILWFCYLASFYSKSITIKEENSSTSLALLQQQNLLSLSFMMSFELFRNPHRGSLAVLNVLLSSCVIHLNLQSDRNIATTVWRYNMTVIMLQSAPGLLLHNYCRHTIDICQYENFRFVDTSVYLHSILSKFNTLDEVASYWFSKDSENLASLNRDSSRWSLSSMYLNDVEWMRNLDNLPQANPPYRPIPLMKLAYYSEDLISISWTRVL